ncbi:MAG: VPLPA-CTERM sorting domain-containing protein [Syntrophaceae bacterium]|nr:VPLPA-CTERM sorting domain-containing protein [Syntrophaceae bacterium]
MKYASIAAILVLFMAGTATASTVDFRTSAFSGAMNQPTFAAGIGGNTVTLTALPTGARIWWDSTDGLGVRYSYENDEIEGVERLRIGFAAPVQLSSVLLTDLFNESGYLERGAYQLNGTGAWISFQALPDQTPGTNGELMLMIDSSVPVSSITFRAPGWLPLLNQRHEFSVAKMETAPVPIPGAVWLLGTGLLGLAAIRRRFRK